MFSLGFSFGSFGDIVSATEIAIKLVTVLSSSIGASEEYQALLAEVTSFYGVLQGVGDLLSYTQKTNPLPDSVERQINLTIYSSKKVLIEIEAAVMSCKKRLKKGSYKEKAEESWRKIGWALFRPNELAEMRRRLAGCQTQILALLCVLQR